MIVTFIEGCITGMLMTIGIFALLNNCYEENDKHRNENGNKDKT